jgi:signal transduction histidine kinase
MSKPRSLIELERYIWAVAVAWTLVIATSLTWNALQERQQTVEAARIQARIAYEKDVVYRRWNASHGGVYVPATDETPPNPYLSDVPDRDIAAPSGKLLTLMNPAYMTRQVHEIEGKATGIQGHITSLNPIRPQNAADPWETKALQAFERGVTEVNSIEQIDGQEYMRLMRPLVTEQACLGCHAKQGYREGDIRGGLGVAVPMQPLWAIERGQVRMLASAHVLLWLTGMGGIVWGSRRLQRAEREQQQTQDALREQALELQQRNEELNAFAHTVAHDLKNPLALVTSYADVLMDEQVPISDQERTTCLSTIVRAGHKMDNIIQELLLLSQVRQAEIELHRLDMAGILAEARQRTIETSNGNQVEVTAPTASAWPVALGYGPWIEEVWVNYLSNAVKYGGRPPRVELGGELQPDGMARFWVRDNGAGLAPEAQARLFTPFTRLDQARAQGHGLGLSIVRRIVEKLGGQVGVESQVGQGSTFYFTLPAAPPME